MSFDAHQDVVSRLLNNSIYRIPRNQRSYVWGEKNWIDLNKDVQLVVEGVSSSHFIGSIVLKSENDEAGLPVYIVIDGQQRLVTLTLAISAILYELKRRGMASDATGTLKYLQATDDSGTQRVIVCTDSHLTLAKLAKDIIRLEVGDSQFPTVNSVIASATVDKKRDKNIADAFGFFVQEFAKKDDEALLSYRNSLVGIQYVRIAATTDEDSYTIFEILNARGIELEDHELLKNYIMRYISPMEKRDDAKQIWSQIENEVGTGMKDFLRHYAIHRYGLSSAGRGAVYKEIRDLSDPRDAEDLLYDLRRKASYYREITDPDSEQKDGKVFAFFKSQRVRVYRPLLLSLMHRREAEDIDQDTYVKSMRFLRVFHVCHKVIGGLDSNQLTASIAKHSHEIEMAYKESSLDSWIESFKRKLPNKDQTRDALLTLGWSNRWDRYEGTANKDRCKLVIELIEESKTGSPLVGEYTVEHILPDAEGQGHALVGNMLPLEPKLNKRCADKPLEDKLAIYLQSNFATTRAFASRYQGKDFDIRKRTQFMANDLHSLIERASAALKSGGAV